jgi:hypothetical protein
MELDDLSKKTRELIGDVEHAGNTKRFTPAQVVDALNQAQCRMAEITHCTYQEAETSVDENGLIDFLNPVALTEFGVMKVDRVDAEDPSLDPDATITAVDTVALADLPILANVPDQTDAIYRWMIAGGTISAGQGTREITFTASKAGKVFLACSVTLYGQLEQGTKTIIVTAT